MDSRNTMSHIQGYSWRSEILKIKIRLPFAGSKLRCIVHIAIGYAFILFNIDQ